jgi:hypothetical protein
MVGPMLAANAVISPLASRATASAASVPNLAVDEFVIKC